MISGPWLHKSSITDTNKSFLVMPFILMIAFISTKVLNIFKDPETDGTELMIASKPITRTQIIFGKFFTLYILIGIFSIFTFICSLAIAQADKYASSSEVLTFSLSMGFGTWIISMLLAAIIIFFSSIMGKIGTIVFSLLVPLIFALTSTSMAVFVTHNLSRERGDNMAFSQSTYVIENNKVALTKTAPGFEPDSPNNKSGSDPIETLEKIYKKHESDWYKYVAYGDVWNQLTKFYFIFNKSKPSISNADYKYRVSSTGKASDVIADEFKVKVRRHAYGTNESNKLEAYKKDGKIVSADIVYSLRAMTLQSWSSKEDIDRSKRILEALNNARIAYQKSSDSVKANIKSIFEDWASNVLNNPPSNWHKSQEELKNTAKKLISAIPKFFGTYVIREGNDTYDTLLSYLLLNSLKDGLSLEARSALLSAEGSYFSADLIPVGVNIYKPLKEDKSIHSLRDMSTYDKIIFGSSQPYQEAVLNKLTPSKYIPDILVYLVWPLFTLLLSLLIILKYMKRDFR